jgi:hypothetical protein
MKKILLKRMIICASVTALCMGWSVNTRATFVIDLDPGGIALNLDAGSGNSGSGTVGTDVINITTIQMATFASGLATIKPAKDNVLTSITFTPENPFLFGDFSFRGQLNNAGTVTLTVHGATGQTFTFVIPKANQDFDRIGIISLDGDTIQDVTISGDFKEQKQTEFSYASQVPEPTTLIAGALLLLPLGVSTLRIMRKRHAA